MYPLWTLAHPTAGPSRQYCPSSRPWGSIGFQAAANWCLQVSTRFGQPLPSESSEDMSHTESDLGFQVRLCVDFLNPYPQYSRSKNPWTGHGKVSRRTGGARDFEGLHVDLGSLGGSIQKSRPICQVEGLDPWRLGLRFGTALRNALEVLTSKPQIRQSIEGGLK